MANYELRSCKDPSPCSVLIPQPINSISPIDSISKVYWSINYFRSWKHDFMQQFRDYNTQPQQQQQQSLIDNNKRRHLKKKTLCWSPGKPGPCLSICEIDMGVVKTQQIRFHAKHISWGGISSLGTRRVTSVEANRKEWERDMTWWRNRGGCL